MDHFVFIGKGSGYADDKLFDDYTVISHPLPNRKDRVFGRDERGHNGTDYGPHSIQLAVRVGYDYLRAPLYLLIKHGGGSEVVKMPAFYDRGEMRAALLALPERILYSVLYTVYHTADEARRQGKAEENSRWQKAYLDGRIKKVRNKQQVQIMS